MTIDVEAIIEIGKLIGALGVIAGLFIAIFKWFQKQEKQTTDIKALQDTHNTDINVIQEELRVVCFALLATLDGLKQQGCNGNVTEAYENLKTHINQKAHNGKR